MDTLNIIARLHATKEMAKFSVTDMANWCGASRPTMSAWLVRGNQPRALFGGLLHEPLSLLEYALTHKPLCDRFPVPLSVNQYNRKDYIKELYADALSQFRESDSATQRNKMLGHPE